MPKLNQRVELLHKTIDDSSGFPTEVLTSLGTTWAYVTQLASERIETENGRIQATERIRCTIRFREIPNSLVVRFSDTNYYVTEHNMGNFDKRYITLYADKNEGAW